MLTNDGFVRDLPDLSVRFEQIDGRSNDDKSNYEEKGKHFFSLS